MIAAAAVIAPLLSELFARIRVPSVLFELILGVLIGPAVLGIAHVDSFVKGLSTLGLAFLSRPAARRLRCPGGSRADAEGPGEGEGAHGCHNGPR